MQDCLCAYVCVRGWVGGSGVRGVYYWSPAALHLSLFSVVKHEAKSLLNLRSSQRDTHILPADLCLLSPILEIQADTNTRPAEMSI